MPQGQRRAEASALGHILPITIAGLALLLASPVAVAGTLEAPELTDAAGDCSYALGNEYADVVAGWVSDESSTHFNANIALAKWTLAQVAEFSGYTLQFTHQGKQFGAAAFYANGQWEYSNAFIDLDSGEMSEFVEAEGSFAPGEPSILSIQFAKAHFPHGDSADNSLRDFEAGTADFKWYGPSFITGQDNPVPPPFFGCDVAAGDGIYEFSVGGHSTHDMSADNASADPMAVEGDDASDAASPDAVAPLAAPEPSSGTPGVGALGILGASGLALRLKRRV